MKTILKVAVFCIVLIAAIGLVFAANNEKAAANGAEKNMTYGKCVSAGVELKNTCYETSKANLKTCKDTAGEDKAAIKKCSSDYKKEKKDCKASFKSAKNECKKIKHNFLETLGSSMK